MHIDIYNYLIGFLMNYLEKPDLFLIFININDESGSFY
jgi:hypothetical protein